MWLRSIYAKTLRDQRAATLAWGLGLGVVVAANLSLVSSLTGTPEARASLVAIAESFRWYAEPVEVLSPSGYVTWRVGPLLPVLLGIWALLAGSRTLRGEEERGALDVLLSLPRTRGRVAAEKLAALATALLAMALLIAVLTLASGSRAGAGFGPGAALLFGLNAALAAAVYGALAFFLSQFTRQRGTAAGITGALLALSFALASTARVTPEARWLGWLSPLHYYSRSKPLVAGHGADAGALLLLALLTALLGGLGAWLFLRRDVGAAVTVPVRTRPAAPARRGPARPGAAWSLRSVYTRGLGTIATSAFWWGLALAAYAAWSATITRQMQEFLGSTPAYAQLVRSLGGEGASVDATFLGGIFAFLPLLLAAFAITQVARWAGDEEDGRLDLLLATPQPRPVVLLSRFAALATAVLLIAGVLLAATALAARASGLALDGGHLVAAALGMVPLALVVAAAGYLLAGWLRAAAVTALLGALLVASFLLNFLGAAFDWPDAVLQLSLFRHYGTPLVSGPPWPNLLGLLAVAAAALATATVRFARKDIGR